MLPLDELKEHIYTLPDQPDLIPYKTSYYAERWGFCMSHNALQALPPGNYTAVVDATLEDGSLTYGEHVIAGACEDEVLLSAHVCHPSLANDNCSGLALLTLAGAGARPARNAPFLPLRVRAGHDRRHHLARQERGARAPHQARAGRCPASVTPAVPPTRKAAAATL